MGNWLGVDFGTSNSGAGVMAGDRPFLIPLEAGEETLPTALFMEQGAPIAFGRAAQRALIAGREGRYMRALKSVLGTELMREERNIMGRRVTLLTLVAAFLEMVRLGAEASCHQRFDKVVSGRPVRFHPDPARDARAQADLLECYTAAGFVEVAFLPEPEAAALAYGASDEMCLIVDIGGGTSDFTLFQQGAVLASHGIRLGGTDFDRAISLAHVMPLLGRGGMIRDTFGPGQMEAPQAVFHDLATWAKIPFLYTPETRRTVGALRKQAVEPILFERLETVLEAELGHDVAFAVERGKMDVNGASGAAKIDLRVVEPGLVAPLGAADVADVLSDQMAMIAQGARETIAMANLRPDQVERVIYVGGSSLMQGVGVVLRSVLPKAQEARAEAFTAVVDGLARAAGARQA